MGKVWARFCFSSAWSLWAVLHPFPHQHPCPPPPVPLHRRLEGGTVASISLILCFLHGNQVTGPSLKLKGPLLKAFSEKQRPAHSRAQWLLEPRRTFEDALSSPPASTKKQTFLTTASPRSLPYLASRGWLTLSQLLHSLCLSAVLVYIIFRVWAVS